MLEINEFSRPYRAADARLTISASIDTDLHCGPGSAAVSRAPQPGFFLVYFTIFLTFKLALIYHTSMIEVDVIWDSGWPNGHVLQGYRGALWINLSTACAVSRFQHPSDSQVGRGMAILWESGGSLVVDVDRPEELLLQSRRNL